MAKEKHSSGPKEPAEPMPQPEAQRRLAYAASALKVWAEWARLDWEREAIGETDRKTEHLQVAMGADDEDQIRAVLEMARHYWLKSSNLLFSLSGRVLTLLDASGAHKNVEVRHG